MRFGITGLGRMGANLAQSAMDRGHDVVGYDRNYRVTRKLAERGLDPATSPEDLVRRLPQPRVVLIYVPHGDSHRAGVPGAVRAARGGGHRG